jgi:hypothetical protein
LPLDGGDGQASIDLPEADKEVSGLMLQRLQSDPTAQPLTGAELGAGVGAGKVEGDDLGGAADVNDASLIADQKPVRRTIVAEQQDIREIFVLGLRDAHAMEHQALALMDRQIEHLARYADVEVRLRSHRGETERQIERLDTILDRSAKATAPSRTPP